MDFGTEIALPLVALLCGAAFMAGLVDAMVGGGGLVQIPVMFSALPHTPVATLLGTSKLAGIWGTSAAAWRYTRSIKLEWGAVLPGALAAFCFSFLGALTVTLLPGDWLRKLLPFILFAVAVYTFRKKDLGLLHAPSQTGARQRWSAMAMGAAIGFYDGFFGPGTGSFLVFLFVRFFGFDFLRASAAAKVVNVSCNLSALLWFGASGHVIVALGLAMAVFNVGGALLGSRLAIKHGSQLVRKLFLVVVALLIVKSAYDAFVK